MATLTDRQRVDDLRWLTRPDFQAWLKDEAGELTTLTVEELGEADWEANLHQVVAVHHIWMRHARPAISLATLTQQAQRAGTTQAYGNDLSLASFWKDAYTIADALGYCDQFEALAHQLGGPTFQRFL